MSEQVQLLEVESIHRAPWNRAVGDVTELAESIREQGVLQPVIVRPNADGFQLVMGERRWTAAKVAGLVAIPVIIRELSDQQALEQQIVENLQRKDIDPLEEAEGYRLLVEEHGLSQAEVATKVGRSEGHVSKRLSLLELPDAAKDALSAGKVTLEAALELRKLKDHPDKVDEVLDAAGRRDMTAEDIEWEIRGALQEIERERAELEAKQRAESEGIKLVAYPNYSGKSKLLSKAQSAWNNVPFTKAEHKAEPCHAAAITPRHDGGKFVYVCTDPKRHTATGDSKLKLPVEEQQKHAPAPKAKETKADKDARLRREGLAAARDSRKAFITTIVRELRRFKISKNDVADLLTAGILHTGYDGMWEARPDAAVALQVVTQEDADKDPDKVDGLIEAFVAKGALYAQRAAIAIVLFSGEERWTEPRIARWQVEFLVKHGYELSDLETAELAKTKDAES